MVEDMVAVIMAGGTGTRFWPVSRKDRPKQVLSIGGEKAMLAATIDRLLPILEPERIFVITAQEHEEPVRAVCDKLPGENILGEPEGRDTAACAGWGGIIGREMFGPQTVIGVFPADHRIQPAEKFQSAVSSAAQASRQLDSIVTFGVRPSFPSTGYGYIEYDEQTASEVEGSKIYDVNRFTEKPKRPEAEQFLEAGKYLWNSGMFFWTAGRILSEIETHMPELFAGLEKIAEKWRKTGSWSAAVAGDYSELPAISVDYGILENSRRIKTLPVDFDWNDLGTWDALLDLFEADAEGNIELGDALSVNSENSFVFNSGGPFVGMVGVDDLIVVSTSDAVLVCSQDSCQEVKELVNRLKEENRQELL
jgi:mannose-1-phosphate guanylyltransferase